MIWAASLLVMALPACQVLKPAEVQAVVGAAVTIDRDQSGPGDEEGSDFCAWKTPEGRFVILGVHTKTSAAAARVQYAARLVEAFGGGGGPAAQTVAGVGDEAQYRNYVGGLKGGVVVVRAGLVVFTLEGPMARDAILGLSNLVLVRVGSH
ncbi:MAG TPA: hypothetical protein VGQ18_05980 [Gemmatimonadales bacterium]|jgi:hypothetical protein|nr:hypothetical protein [Gemmatimonadales bacterium]